MAALSRLLLLSWIIAALLLRSTGSQCVSNCGCPLDNVCCLIVQENQPSNTVIGRDDSPATLAKIAAFSSPVFVLERADLGDTFQINPTTGVISTLKSLDREARLLLTLQVMAA